MKGHLDKERGVSFDISPGGTKRTQKAGSRVDFKHKTRMMQRRLSRAISGISEESPDKRGSSDGTGAFTWKQMGQRKHDRKNIVESNVPGLKFHVDATGADRTGDFDSRPSVDNTSNSDYDSEMDFDENIMMMDGYNGLNRTNKPLESQLRATDLHKMLRDIIENWKKNVAVGIPETKIKVLPRCNRGHHLYSPNVIHRDRLMLGTINSMDLKMEMARRKMEHMQEVKELRKETEDYKKEVMDDSDSEFTQS